MTSHPATSIHPADGAEGPPGGKGANLAEMTSVLELPVPPGFTITTDACRAYMVGGWPDGLDEEVDHLAALERNMGRRLGDPATTRCWCRCGPGPSSRCPG